MPQESPDFLKREYRISRAQTAVPPDSRWHSPCWEKIPALALEEELWCPGESSGFRPDAQAKLQYDDHFLYALYLVHDQYICGEKKKDQEMVCQDSAMELFLRPNATGNYYNFECNCIGTLLLYEISPDIHMTPLPLEELATVKRSADLPRTLHGEIQVPTTWQLLLQIPIEFFIRHCGIQLPLSGQHWSGNVYKCADHSSHPHWLQWQKASDFHVPKEFGNFFFE